MPNETELTEELDKNWSGVPGDGNSPPNAPIKVGVCFPHRAVRLENLDTAEDA